MNGFRPKSRVIPEHNKYRNSDCRKVLPLLRKISSVLMSAMDRAYHEIHDYQIMIKIWLTVVIGNELDQSVDTAYDFLSERTPEDSA